MVSNEDDLSQLSPIGGHRPGFAFPKGIKVSSPYAGHYPLILRSSRRFDSLYVSEVTLVTLKRGHHMISASCVVVAIFIITVNTIKAFFVLYFGFRELDGLQGGVTLWAPATAARTPRTSLVCKISAKDS